MLTYRRRSGRVRPSTSSPCSGVACLSRANPTPTPNPNPNPNSTPNPNPNPNPDLEQKLVLREGKPGALGDSGRIAVTVRG